MSAEQFIAQFGYLALFAGAFFEGEVVVITAAFAAHQGYLSLPWVMVYAFLGALSGDEFYFFLGRLKGRAFIQRRPLWQMRVRRVQRLLERHCRLIILCFRFLYGFRMVTPLALGMSGVRIREFVLFNLLGSSAWSVAVASFGFLFGATCEALLKNTRTYERWAMLAILGAGALGWIGYLLRRRSLRRLAAARLAEEKCPSPDEERGKTATPSTPP